MIRCEYGTDLRLPASINAFKHDKGSARRHLQMFQSFESKKSPAITMAFVFQCTTCRNIVGDSDVTPVPGKEDTFQLAFPEKVDLSRHRVKCPTCKEVIGVEDDEDKISLMPEKVSSYKVKCCDPTDLSRKKPRTMDESGNDDQEAYATVSELKAQKLEYKREMIQMKEALLALSELVSKLS